MTECVNFGTVFAPLQEFVGSHRQLVKGFKGMANDAIVCGRAPLATSVNCRTFLVEHLVIVRDNVEITSDTYVAVRRNRIATKNSVSKSGAREFEALVAR